MKGIVFREFLDMVEHAHGLAVVDRIITESAVPSGGVYTTVGSYDHVEMIQLVQRLSEITGVPFADSVRAFGHYLFPRFVKKYDQFFVGIDSAFTFLQRVHGIVHLEVRKLYPDAELPSFDCSTVNAKCLAMTYRSQRPFAELARGLIAGCIDHFGEPIDIQAEDLSPTRPGTCVRFLLTSRSNPTP
jgi:hypothetical protein